MSEERYRLCLIVLLAIFVAGALFIGWQFSQNGRLVQHDKQKDYMVYGDSAKGGTTDVIYTRTGAKLRAK